MDMNESDIYQNGLDRYGESPLALHWTDYRSMAIRFKNLIKDLDVEDKTILDAGCGMGDLLPYLYSKADNFKYLGVDINSGFIDIAKKRYENHRFEVGNPFSGKFGQQFDLVVTSGVMNINVKNWQSNRKTMIKNLFALSREALAFNMAGNFGKRPRDNLIAYANIDEIVDFCKNLTTKVTVRADYLPDDFTVTMFR